MVGESQHGRGSGSSATSAACRQLPGAGAARDAPGLHDQHDPGHRHGLARALHQHRCVARTTMLTRCFRARVYGRIVRAGAQRRPGRRGRQCLDDIVYPPAAPAVTGNVTVTVKTITGGRTRVDPAGYRVDLLYAANGSEDDVSDTTGAVQLRNVPIGIHAMRVVKTSQPQCGSRREPGHDRRAPGQHHGRRAVVLKSSRV